MRKKFIRQIKCFLLICYASKIKKIIVGKTFAKSDI